MPVQLTDGTLQEREKGTPQGGVISPLLANLFLHYTFDVWMGKNYPELPFERYADDVICHCRTKDEAMQLLDDLRKRFQECGLELHPEKTKIIYCKDDNRRGGYTQEKFDFLSFTFRPRLSRNRWGKFFVSFSPAISKKAEKSVNQQVRGWQLYRSSRMELDDIARMVNPVIRGWINYYGSYHKSALDNIGRQIDKHLAKWVRRKYKKFRKHKNRAIKWIRDVKKRQPGLFAHLVYAEVNDWTVRAG